jgi:bifunctional non-homologous end joining protein LigD
VSLLLYNKKRDFRKSPEPPPVKTRMKKKKLSFVVQKHDATRLHYDFRLEMDGVLKSWAIPKGPSMAPGDKRLAIMVEDHPLEYGRFFGEIPKGNYGAGIVEIWDKGTYVPSAESGDPEKNLHDMFLKGDIKFSLNGTHLKGRFALFNLKNSEKENEWMLVKKADEFAIEVFDISSLPSLKSRNITKAQPGKKNKPDPFPEPLPSPMLATLVPKVIDNPSWIYEMKLDGYRMLCSVRDGNVELVSRNGNHYSNQFMALLDDLRKIEENIVLDGEVVVENSDGISDFQLLQNYVKTRKGILKYYVFDILYFDGHNIMRFSLGKRKELLAALFNKYDFINIAALEYQTGNGPALFQRLSAAGYEGIIAKDPESSYLQGKRGDSWLKVKSAMSQEAVICGFTEPQGSRKYFGSLILGIYNDNDLIYIGNCGTGFTDATLKELYGKFEKLKTENCCFKKPPELSRAKGKAVWIKPELVANVKFQEWSDGAILRNPVFIALREDKDPEEVVKEINITKVPDTRGKGVITTMEKTLTPGVDKIRLTNTSKIYWTNEGYTKGDLIAYYNSISSLILPYLKNRPQSLNRYPHGIGGESFYQKNMDHNKIPSWIKTVKMESGTNPEGIGYLICNDQATLIYIINLGCIEINPWHSIYTKPENPTYLMLDLDPGEISFKMVIDTALVIKELCDELKIPSYCKTSGATGLHVYIPLGGKYNYAEARTFAEILAVLVHNRLPAITSIERTVSKRKDKVYIDFLQNRKGQTIAAPYCVRPRPMATVSTPLDWKEVDYRLSPEMFTIKNVEQRIRKTGDLWKPVLGKGINISKALKEIEKLG